MAADDKGHASVNRIVAGSSPARGANILKNLDKSGTYGPGSVGLRHVLGVTFAPFSIGCLNDKDAGTGGIEIASEAAKGHK